MANINKLKAVIIEDELPFQEYLESMLKLHFSPNIELLGIANSVSTGIKLIQEQKPDLVFMDVELGNGVCFDILKVFETIDFWVVFTTSHQNYAFKALQTLQENFRYYLKPIQVGNIMEVLAKYKPVKQVEGFDNSVYTEYIQHIDAGKSVKWIYIKGVRMIRRIPVDRILRVSNSPQKEGLDQNTAEKGVVWIYCLKHSATYQLDQMVNSQEEIEVIRWPNTMSSIERILPKTEFCSIRSTDIVNKKFIVFPIDQTKSKDGRNKTYEIKTADNPTPIQVSFNRKERFERFMNL